FRIHAEFQLNEPPNFPFWFSPGQFTGYIVLSKDSSHVRDFRLLVPNNSLDLYPVLEPRRGLGAGPRQPVPLQMELESTGPSVPSVIHDEDGKVLDSRDPSGEPIHFVFEEITWQQQIPWQEAAHRLEVAMYPFKKVSYLPFTEAFERAQAEKKLVHSILLWAKPPVPLPVPGSGRTLRETVLESSPILALLNESFISSWSLVKELEELQSNRENELHSKLAKLHLEKYNFPVEMIICLPNGTVIHHINANYFLDITSMKPEDVESSIFSFSTNFEDPSTATYLQFLKEGLHRAKPYLQP
ncbi:SELN protein, partial [Calcarius ornatus]|nr:SELN protein [Calcarius ornatus]